MRYLCIVWVEPGRLDALGPGGYDALVVEGRAYDEELRRSGHLVAAHALEPPDAAVTIRPRSGRATVTDGPFVETKEQIGGFLLVEARDLNEAIQLASRMPPARLGGIEVRPVRQRGEPA